MNNALKMTSLAPNLKTLLGVCAFTCLVGVSNPSYAAQQIVDRVRVLVNDSAITEAELRNTIEILRARNANASAEQLRKTALEELILISLQEQEARRLGLSVDNATLDRAMQNLAKQNKLSLTNFRKQAASQGVDWNKLRESVRQQILVERLRDREVLRRINVSEQEVDDFLAAADVAAGQPQYQLEHFVVPLPVAANDEAKRRAEAAVNQLQRALADKRSAQQIVNTFKARNIPLEGGSLGWRNARDLPQPMNEIVPKLMTNEASEPVVDGQGIHILRLLAVRQTKSSAVEQSNARHILLKLNPLRDAESAKAELDSVRKQVLNGEDFAALAHKLSEDYASGVSGGDLGWFGPGAMVPVFEENLKLLAPGQISQPFESPFGWHLVKLEGRRQAQAPISERRLKAKAAIAETKRDQTTVRWLQQLRDQAYLEYPDEK